MGRPSDHSSKHPSFRNIRRDDFLFSNPKVLTIVPSVRPTATAPRALRHMSADTSFESQLLAERRAVVYKSPNEKACWLSS